MVNLVNDVLILDETWLLQSWINLICVQRNYIFLNSPKIMGLAMLMMTMVIVTRSDESDGDGDGGDKRSGDAQEAVMERAR